MIAIAAGIIWIFLMFSAKDAYEAIEEKKLWEKMPDSAACQVKMTDKGLEIGPGCQVEKEGE